jgi:hypothetical protein
LLSSCTDLTVAPVEILGISDLIVLSQQSNAPAPPVETVWISNSRRTIVRIIHPDNFNTLYLELTFPTQSLESLNGAPLSSTDSLEVTIAPRQGQYGFDLSPSGIQFNPGSEPTAVFSFSVYGDASAGTSSTTYASSADYVAALDIWNEVTVDQWQIASDPRSTGVDEVGASVETSGRFVLAAPR